MLSRSSSVLVTASYISSLFLFLLFFILSISTLCSLFQYLFSLLLILNDVYALSTPSSVLVEAFISLSLFLAFLILPISSFCFLSSNVSSPCFSFLFFLSSSILVTACMHVTSLLLDSHFACTHIIVSSLCFFILLYLK